MLVKSFDDKSNTLNDVRFCANSCGIEGNSLRDKYNSRKYGNGISGTVVNDTLLSPSFIKLFCKPKKALSITFKSLLLERSRLDRRGKVANEASSNRYKRLFDRFSTDND